MAKPHEKAEDEGDLPDYKLTEKEKCIEKVCMRMRACQTRSRTTQLSGCGMNMQFADLVFYSARYSVRSHTNLYDVY